MRRGETTIHPLRPRGDFPPEQYNAVIQVPGLRMAGRRELASPARHPDARAADRDGRPPPANAADRCSHLRSTMLYQGACAEE